MQIWNQSSLQTFCKINGILWHFRQWLSTFCLDALRTWVCWSEWLSMISAEQFSVSAFSLMLYSYFQRIRFVKRYWKRLRNTPGVQITVEINQASLVSCLHARSRTRQLRLYSDFFCLEGEFNQLWVSCLHFIAAGYVLPFQM